MIGTLARFVISPVSSSDFEERRQLGEENLEVTFREAPTEIRMRRSGDISIGEPCGSQWLG
jgi:hypothetical protein